MKRFIILTTTIRNVGGAQMYAANKMSYYEQLGWKPDVFFHNVGPVRIGYLKQFEGNLIPELLQPFRDCGEKIREVIAHRILDRYDKQDEFLFECHTPELAYWGEYFAKVVNGKSTIYLLEEVLPKFTEGELSFYEYKYERKELLNNSANGLQRVLQVKYDTQIHCAQGNEVKPYCDNVVDYTPISLPQEVEGANYNILSIGRLDKPYIMGMLDEILLFSSRHQDKIMNLIIVGGDLYNKVNERIIALFKDRPNVRLFLLGYVFPVPYDWIKLADVSIASSNSILVSANEGVPTIGIDIHDFLPIGVYGHTTQNLWARDSEPQTPLSEWLEEVLVQRKYVKKLVEHNMADDLGAHLKPHLDLLNASDKTKEYYDVEHMYSKREQFVYKVKKILRPVYSRLRKK